MNVIYSAANMQCTLIDNTDEKWHKKLRMCAWRVNEGLCTGVIGQAICL